MWGRRGRRRGHRHQFWSTGLTGWQREAIAAQAADQRKGTIANSPADAPPVHEEEVVALRETVDQLAQSVRDLELRLQKCEGASD
jgi:hypothetical protein